MKDLGEYRRKRDFGRSPEPRGAPRPPSARGLRFCVQRHHARRLHFDFRLELDGVLKSWAVPKGPSLDPGERRLAVEVEDHPLEYRTFEGTIPEGEYGAGRVVLWDEGLWIPEGDPRRGLARGRLRFVLRGRKLTGRWTLVRTSGAPEKPQWLLIRSKHGAPAAPEVEVGLPSRSAPALGFVEPMLATLVKRAPRGKEWIHELKFDGYRILARIEGGRATLWSRGGKDWTRHFPETASALGALKTTGTLIDGELVALDARGASKFQALQGAILKGRTASLVYQAFDALWLDGEDLRSRPLLVRKKALASILGPARKEGRVRYTDHVAGSGEEFRKAACRFELEGIVSKRSDAPYRSGRSPDWRKLKCLREQEFVIGGFTDPQGSRGGLGSLLLGYYRPPRELVYAGRVGTGFGDALLLELREWLSKLEQGKEPFREGPRGPERKGVHWVKPVLVAEVKFSGWTDDGRLRHPVFAGIRQDQRASQVRREVPRDPAP
jgi:bifunctional non-homologous end joining protein LigD